MKILTITCHNVYNYGASLQAYALMRYLQSLGHEVKIIDYVPKYLEHYYLFGHVSPKYDKPVIRGVYNIVKFPKRLYERISSIRKKEFDSFTKTYLELTDTHFKHYSDLKKEKIDADLIIAGSDQIWNTLFENGRDPAFYLDFVPQNVKKVSYAASFATASIDEGYKEKIKEWLSNLDYISVREKSGLQILDDMGVENGVQVLDPVFLLDKEQWIQIEKPLEINDRYLLLYDFGDNPMTHILAKRIAREKKIKIYSILKSEIADKSFYNEGPNVFVWLIHHAEYVISNSFHATAFSIIFNKQFVVCGRKEGINTRMLDLTEMLGLMSNVCLDMDCQLGEIDYNQVNHLLSQYITKSRRFLEKVME